MLSAGFDYTKLYDAALRAAPWMLSLAVVSIFGLYQRFKPFQISSEVPGPPRKPFFGIAQFLQDNQDRLPTVACEFSDKFDRTWGGPMPLIGCTKGAFFCLVDEVCVKHILQDQQQNYIKGEIIEKLFGDIFGRKTSVHTTDGKEWKAHRKIFSSMFTRSILRQSTDLMKSKLVQAAQLINARLEEQKASGGSFIVLDLQDFFSRVMLDVSVQFGIGVEIDSLRNDQPFSSAFDEVLLLGNQRLADPFFELKRSFGLGRREMRIKELFVVISRFCNDIISNKHHDMASGKGLNKDVISAYSNKAIEIIGHELSIAELRDNLLVSILAGKDTTSATLTWAFYEFTRHPEVVERVLAEVEEICGLGQNADFSFDALNKLEYTHAVAMEVLRLHPSVPMDLRRAVMDDILPDGTFIPAMSSVFYSPFAMGRSKKIWGDDAEKFKPERFYKKPEPSAFKFLAFNAGPRICLGKPYALMNIKLAFAFLLQEFRFRDAAVHSGDYTYSVALFMKGGFPVQVSKKL